MKRRAFITLLGGAAAAWPLAGRAQQGERMRRIAMLWIIAGTDPQAIRNREMFLKQLHQLGWRVGDNVHIDHRSAADDANRQRAYASELIGLAPELLWPRAPRGLLPCSWQRAPFPLSS
jgi:putative tryptophan/tyrosine transport system substrate-binding protein